MRKQIKFIFQIGLPHSQNPEPFRAAIAAAASSYCGGCTMAQKTGYWVETGATRQERFNGQAYSETCIELELTCEQAKAESVYQGMAVAIAREAKAHAIDTNWVHVSEIPMTGRHFSVAHILNEIAA